jgi:hypothetical protein
MPLRRTRQCPCPSNASFGADAQADSVRFWVSDTGPGIDLEHLAHVFDRYGLAVCCASMLPLLLLLVATQAPPVPGETTLVSFCKQGRLSACEALRQTNPRQAAEIEKELATSALRLGALRVAEGEARDQQGDEGSKAEPESSCEPDECKGQNHHIISRPIAEKLKEHKVLNGLFTPRDPRFVARARNKEAHCGYQEWHRQVDDEVVEWLDDHPKATLKQFMRFLREIYDRPKMRERFPHGF